MLSLYYVNDFVYWYTSEAIGKRFVDALGKRLHVKFLEYAHWFIPIRLSQMKDNYISVDQAIYATPIVAKFLDTAITETSKKFYSTNFHLILSEPKLMYLLLTSKLRS